MTYPRHLGIQCRLPRRCLQLNKRNYIYRTRRGTYLFRDGWLKDNPKLWAEHRRRCLLNYDLSMAYFKSLSRDDFEAALEGVLARFPQFEEVSDLRAWDGVCGVYIMVIGRRCQLYVGKAEGAGGIKRRILRHWRNAVPFDRLISGDPQTSIMPVDCFRALDTTAVYAARSEHPGPLERLVADAVPDAFSLNRTRAGDLAGGLSEAIRERRTRDLIGCCAGMRAEGLPDCL